MRLRWKLHDQRVAPQSVRVHRHRHVLLRHAHCAAEVQLDVEEPCRAYQLARQLGLHVECHGHPGRGRARHKIALVQEGREVDPLVGEALGETHPCGVGVQVRVRLVG